MRRVIGLLKQVSAEPVPPELDETLLPQFRKAREKQP
jgi:hypothetical protein